MAILLDNHIRLKDGSTLGYAEHGDPNGMPVFHFHGTPSSRMEAWYPTFNEVASRLGVRMILPERPGYGLSSFKPGWTMLDWPDTIVELADHLGIEQFAVSGISGGGPYVAACASKIPERLRVASIVSGLAPLDIPGALDGMTRTDQQSYQLARQAPWLLRLAIWYLGRQLKSKPGQALADAFAELSEPDKAIMEREGVVDLVAHMFQGGLAQGGRGATHEYVLFTRPWGFQLEAIRVPVYLWHGEDDRMVPVTHGRYLARTIPDCKARFFPNEGHLSLIINHFEEILAELVC